jgi:hypothetical protein
MDEVQLIISDSFDRRLDDREAELLASKLRDDEAWMNQYVLSSFIHSQLIDWSGQERMQDYALTGGFAQNRSAASLLARNGTCDPIDLSTHQLHPSIQRHAGSMPRNSWLRSVAALAAVILIAASVTLLGYFVATRPVYVGQLTQATDCRWAASLGNIPAGRLLESGQELQLITGRAVITFASGAQILLEGPTTLRLDSPASAHLVDGRIATKVPTHAIGFTVTSPLARFIDLGTAFTLDLKAESGFELYVFEGLVELQLDERFGEAAEQQLRIADVRAVKFDATAGDVSTLPFNQGEQMPF